MKMTIRRHLPVLMTTLNGLIVIYVCIVLLRSEVSHADVKFLYGPTKIERLELLIEF